MNLRDKVSFKGILTMGKEEGTIEEALQFLKKTYCGSIGVEFSYLEVIIDRQNLK